MGDDLKFPSDPKEQGKSFARLAAAFLELTHASQLQSTVLNTIPQLVSYVDSDLVFRYANSCYKAWFGLAEHEIVGKNVVEVLGPHIIDMVMPKILRVLAGERIEFETFAPYLYGKQRSIHVIYIPDFGEGKKVIGFLAVVTDISERIASQKNLAESQKRLQNIFDGVPVGIVELDEQKRFRSANSAFLEFIGYSLEELRGKTMMSVTHPDDVSVSEKMVDGISDLARVVRRFEKRYLTKAGAVVWGLVTSRRVEDPLTGKFNIFTVVEDVSGIKQTEAELAHFFASSLDLMGVANKQGAFRRVNPSFSETLGYTIEEILSRPYLDFVHPDDLEKTKKEMEKLASGFPTLKFENRYRTKDGSYRELGWVAVPSKETDLVYATARDITEKKRDELKLAYSAKMASLGEMAGGIAHEINNPLAIILGKIVNLKFLLEQESPSLAQVKLELEEIEGTGQRIAKIVRGLRAFSRNGDTDPMVESNLLRVLDDTVELCNERLKNSGIELRVECEPTLTLKCRPSQLSQVLMNLIGNSYDAVQALAERWIYICVSQNANSVVISVEDSGPGIDPSIRGKLMQPFFTTKEIGKGTGLGLSISKGIVEAHGGQLRYDESSQHTRFLVELPRR